MTQQESLMNKVKIRGTKISSLNYDEYETDKICRFGNDIYKDINKRNPRNFKKIRRTSHVKFIDRRIKKGETRGQKVSR